MMLRATLALLKKAFVNLQTGITHVKFRGKLHQIGLSGIGPFVRVTSTVKPRYSVFQGAGQNYTLYRVLFIANI